MLIQPRLSQDKHQGLKIHVLQRCAAFRHCDSGQSQSAKTEQKENLGREKKTTFLLFTLQNFNFLTAHYSFLGASKVSEKKLLRHL